MEMHPVDSSLIQALGYDPESKTMAVQFHDGKLYHYQGVTQKVHDKVKNSASVGKAFGQFIRPHHKGLLQR